jgi:tight adherence protein B
MLPVEALLPPVVIGVAIMLMLALRSRRSKKAKGDIAERIEYFGGVGAGAAVEASEARDEPNRMAQSLEDILKGRSLSERMANLLMQADVKMTIGELMMVRLISAAGGFGLGFLILARIQPALGLLFGIVCALVGYGVPAVYLGMKAKRRRKKFIGQLGDTITLMGNSLRAGYSLLQTMELVSRESADPIATEFRRVVREIGLGVSNQEAMHNLLRRVPSDDLDLLVTAINIQHEVGGNLAQILQIIGHTIRERVRIKGEIAVLTAQQSLSAYVICALPVVLAVILFMINPGYMSGLFQWPYVCMPIASAVMVIVGFLIMRKIVAIEV